ncbi:MAG: ABC transporter permease [Thermomicrobium sp.]
MRRLLAAEVLKVTRRPMTWIALGILLAIMATLRILLIAISFVPLPAGDQQSTPINPFVDLVTLPGALADALNFVPSTGVFALLVVAASLAGTEFAWGTIVPLLSRGASRSQLVLAKAAVTLGLIVLYLLPTFALGLLLGAVASQLHYGSLPLDWIRERWLEILLGLVRSFWATVPYVRAATALAILFRSSALAMGTVLAYVIVEQVGLGVFQLLRPMLANTNWSWIASLIDWVLLGANANELTGLTTRAFLPRSPQLGALPASEAHPWRATLVLAAYAIAFLTLALTAIRRDVGTRPTSS